MLCSVHAQHNLERSGRRTGGLRGSLLDGAGHELSSDKGTASNNGRLQKISPGHIDAGDLQAPRG